MLLENMTIDQLNEVFDADNLGTIYPVQDLTPKAKVPQMLHIKVPGTNDLLVRLTHLDTVGTRVKAVQPGDKTVQVFLMSLSEKGNITDFRGGLGTDPVGAINTIFTTVLDISKKFRFDSVLFRIPKNKMKGQERAVQRVLSRLIKNRSGGRFTTLDEIERDESKKFSFVMAYRKNSDVLDQVPLSDNIEKVETKAGDTFIDKDTGKQVSKAEAVASEIVKKAEKITTKSVISKTKVSKQALIAALYGEIETTKMSTAALEVFNDLQSTAEPLSSKGVELSKGVSMAESSMKNSLTTLSYNLERVSQVGRDQRFVNHPATNLVTHVEYQLASNIGWPMAEAESFGRYLLGRISDVLRKAKPLQLNNAFKDIATAALEHEGFRKLTLAQRLDVIAPIVTYIIDDTSEDMSRVVSRSPNLYGTAKWSQAQAEVVKNYCDTSYDLINGFLRGINNPGSPKRLYELVETMDSVFEEHGIRLKKGTLLYRGQKLTKQDFVKTMENKMFYFRNYVSTSMTPIIYGISQFGEGSIAAMLADNPTNADTHTPEEIVQSAQGEVSPQDELMNMTYYGEREVPSISYIISGADKLKVIIPGSLAEYYDEQEVILPRGTVIKYNTVIGGNLDKTADGSALLKNIIVEAEVLDPSLLKESVVYDGDLFMETGEMVAVDLITEDVAEVTESPSNSFSAQFRKPRFENESNEILQALSAIAFKNIKPKFIS